MAVGFNRLVHVKKQTFSAKADALSEVLGFVEDTLEFYGCPVKSKTAICIAIEEIFVNIACYAYGQAE